MIHTGLDKRLDQITCLCLKIWQIDTIHVPRNKNSKNVNKLQIYSFLSFFIALKESVIYNRNKFATNILVCFKSALLSKIDIWWNSVKVFCKFFYSLRYFCFKRCSFKQIQFTFCEKNIKREYSICKIRASSRFRLPKINKSF